MDDWLKRLNGIVLIALAVLVNLCLSLIFSSISYFFTGKNIAHGVNEGMPISGTFFLAVILAPILETIIFQYAIIETAKNKMPKVYACFLSALFFGITHLYNFYYFLFAFIAGLLFAYIYTIGNTVMKSIGYVFTVHVIYNLIIFCIKSF
ncbi:lysostaphin resistance A-like protein [Pedobacter sp. GSP4]|uniref:CPBP family intramembrane glutamic endopeptidase n=1 Tax=Pedobacter sp. GSP4 TaxID=3453716 RepID=UPI003EEC80B9